MAWVCLTTPIIEMPSYGIALYIAEICNGGSTNMWAQINMPVGNCAAPSYPSCYDMGGWYKDADQKPLILRHPDLTKEQNKNIDEVSDLIAYGRLNEPDQDKPRK